ncbi:MAG: phage holin family protein [Myxococcota bacterium]
MRLFLAGRRIARQYAEDAQREAARDARRLGTGVVFCVVGAVFSLHAVIFLHAVAVALLLLIPGARVEVVLGGVFALDALIALTAFLIGFSMLRRPVLTQTRRTFHEMQALLAPMGPEEALDRRA